MKKATSQFLVWSLFFICVFFTENSYATIRRVSPGGNGATGPGTATNWSDAYSDLQAAINASSSGDEIWVAAGSYQPPISTSFTMKEGVAIYGGFTGTELQLTDRDWLTNTTTLQGNGNSVIYNSSNNLTAIAILDGFSITGGSAAKGGGIYNQNASPTLRNLIVLNNSATTEGGGIYNYVSSPTMTRITVSGNTVSGSPGYGGGIYSGFSTSVYSWLVVMNNTAQNGAGMFNYLSNLSITRGAFAGNEADYGAGVFNQSSGPQFVNVVFSQNIAAQAGGANFNQGSNPGPSFVNCTFFGNTAASASIGGGAISNTSSVISITNSIFRANTAVTSPADILDRLSSTSTVSYSITQLFGTDGVNGNMVGGAYDPLFVFESDPDGPDNAWLTPDDGLRIQSGSPAIDVANSVGAPVTDASNYVRPYGPAYDIGAYEYSLDFPLPVMYTYFKAKFLPSRQVLLQWETAQEQNSSYFRVLRKGNNTSFEVAGTIAASGNSANPVTYSYTDDISGVEGNRLFYVLEQTDRDGRRSSSKVITVLVPGHTAAISVFPNPVPGAFVTITSSRFNGAMPYVIRNIAGVVVQSGTITKQKETIGIPNLARGVYFLEVGRESTVKLIKQ